MSAKKGLGKGLDALITQGHTPELPDSTTVMSGIIEIDINKVEPNRQQPRKYFEEESLAELAVSIEQYGIIQPLIVKEENNGLYSIIAGERRWRAARIAKMAAVPVIIKDYTPMETLQIALIENIQRQDLNPIEEALCYKRLTDEFFFKQEDIAQKVGKSRNSISYAMSLLNLDMRVQNFIIEQKLAPSHARALLTIKDDDDQFHFAEKAIDDDLSLRDLERLVKEYLSTPVEEEERPAVKKQSVAYAKVENDLQHILGTKVIIRDGKNKGKIEIEYYSPDELDRLLGMFKRL